MPSKEVLPCSEAVPHTKVQWGGMRGRGGFHVAAALIRQRFILAYSLLVGHAVLSLNNRAQPCHLAHAAPKGKPHMKHFGKLSLAKALCAAASAALTLGAGPRAQACLPGATVINYITNYPAKDTETLGISMALLGSDIVASMPDNLVGVGNGAFFSAKTGVKLADYINPTPVAGDYFGYSVAAAKTDVAFGAPFDDAGGLNTGSVHVYAGKTGAFKFTIPNQTPNASDGFGSSVATNGTNWYVGAPFDDADGTEAGIVHVFGPTGAFLSSIHNPVPGLIDDFGFSLAISGNSLFVGAVGPIPQVYQFDVKTGAFIRTYLNPGTADNKFGHRIAANGKFVVVSAPEDDKAGPDSGAAYLFNSTTGALIRELPNFTPTDGAMFGFSVSMTVKRILVGSLLGAQEYATATGQLVGNFTHPFGKPDTAFGYAVMLNKANNVIISAPGDNVAAPAAGAIYMMKGF